MKNSIAFKLGILIGGIVTVVLLTFGVWNYITMKRIENEKLLSKGQFSINRLVLNLPKSIWEYDPDMVYQLIESEMEERSIYSIVVTNKNNDEVTYGRVRDKKWNIKESKDIPHNNDNMISQQLTWEDGQKLGTVYVYLSDRFVKLALKAKIKDIIVQIVTLNVIVLVLIIIALQKLLLLPLKEVVNAAKAISIGDLSNYIKINTKDEIGQLADSFHNMMEALNKKADVARQIAEGNLFIDVTVPSKKDVLGHAMLTMKKRLIHLKEELQNVINAHKEGKLDIRCSPGELKGAYAELLGGINDVLDAVIQPMNEVVQTLEIISTGDFTTKVEGDYKGDHATMKYALNKTIDSLVDFQNHVANSVEQISSGSQQVSNTTQLVSRDATIQASSVQQITESMKTISTQSTQNSNHAIKADDIISAAGNAAQTGNTDMQRMIAAMEAINDSAQEISKIIKTIDGIAFQTNLLALNAAVEAARAGEQGKGFAVVADEVRNLAQRSANAAKETNGLISGTIERVERGNKIVQETAKTFESIHKNVNEVSLLIKMITSSSKEQAHSIEQMNTELSQIDKVTQSNASSAEENAAATEELLSQTVQLRRLLKKFKLKKGDGTQVVTYHAENAVCDTAL